MPELKFETGLVEYDLNGKCKVSFNPTDYKFAERVYDAFEALGKLQDEYDKKSETSGAGKEAFELAKERDAKMESIIDGLFGKPVCESLFEETGVCAFGDGFPNWLNLMLAIMDKIEADIGDIAKRADPRVAKYTAKYQKYAKKYGK